MPMQDNRQVLVPLMQEAKQVQTQKGRKGGKEGGREARGQQSLVKRPSLFLQMQLCANDPLNAHAM